MTTARLKVDVLATVSEFLTDVSDVLSFSLLCSSIHPVVTRRLLSMRLVSITGDSSVRIFHTFLFADPVAGAPYIRALHIGVPGKPFHRFARESPTFESLVVNIINSCPQIEHVSMFFERNYANDEPVILAIAALRSLRSLTINSWLSEHAPALLRQISAPLPKLVVHSTHVKRPDDLEKILPHLMPTLEELELLYFQVYEGSPPPIDQTSGKTSPANERSIIITRR